MNSSPIRKITNTGTRKNTGLVPSMKNERSITYESLLERDYIYLLEFDDDVVSYLEQPLTIYYTDSNKSRRYTPDFLVVRKNKKQLVEVKPYEKLQQILSDEKQSQKFYIADKYCANNEIDEFVIITEKDINSCFLKNIKYLFAFSRLNVPSFAKLEIRNNIIINNLMYLGDLLSILQNEKIDTRTYYSYILAMIYSHEINANLISAINKNSLVWI